MNENLDLCLILKDCPKDTELYCTFLGDVLFSKIEDNKIFIHTSYTVYSFYSDGKFTYDGECVLFPSREQRDWSKFKVPIKKFNPKDFKPFDKVLLRDDYGFKWCPTFLERFRKNRLANIRQLSLSVNVNGICVFHIRMKPSIL